MGDLGIFGAALAFGIVSAVVPLFNPEAYVVGLGALIDDSSTLFQAIIALSVGTVIGKSLVFTGVRRGVKHVKRDPTEPRASRTRFGAALRRVGQAMLRVMDRPVLGPAVVFVAALTSIPPLAAAAIVAALSQQRLGTFLVMVLLGRTLQFLVIGFVVERMF